MNFIKKTLAVFLSLILLMSASYTVFAADAEIGTAENPENANDRYFSAGLCYLLNTDLEEGDSDGYWYIYTATGAGFACVDTTARDASGNETDAYQVTVEHNDNVYKAFDEIYSRPITPFRLSRGDVLKIHITATPDESGVYPKLKVYCNITTVYGTETDPIIVKSNEGFIANVQTQKTVVYQDGTISGYYGNKGVVISGDKSVIRKTEVTMNGVVYTDTDRDGTIELMLPGDPNAQIPLHNVLSIYNGGSVDASYTVKVVDAASEDANVNHEHTFEFVRNIKEPTASEAGEALYVCSGCGEETTVAVPATGNTPKKGDINNDGSINAVDTNLIKRIIVGGDMDVQKKEAADMNNDGTINAMDSYILRNTVSGTVS